MMYYLKRIQQMPIEIAQAWDFFSNPKNLSVLTPAYLNFMIKSENLKKIYPGQFIEYTIQPLLNIKMQWVTEITHVRDQEYFIDEQRIGPYRLWHHEHRFQPIPNGTEIIDLLAYEMPFGILGHLVHEIKIRRDVEAIFNYREKQLQNLFGIYYP